VSGKTYVDPDEIWVNVLTGLQLQGSPIEVLTLRLTLMTGTRWLGLVKPPLEIPNSLYWRFVTVSIGDS
jgi:hypothetical protein